MPIFEGMGNDNFSSDSDHYWKYRPSYPDEVFDYLKILTPNKGTAWDCGTGNGQVARELAKSFRQVFATDVSQAQIDQAIPAANIHYSVQPAEKTDFKDGQFDLIVVAQAIHWFDFEKFYAEVRRTGKQHALLCIMGYGLMSMDDRTDPIIKHFYENRVGSYWDEERRYIDERYATIPFPFDEIQVPVFINRQYWSLDHLTGYLSTWSAVKHFIRQNGYDPVEQVKKELGRHWPGEEKKQVEFPLLLRVGRL